MSKDLNKVQLTGRLGKDPEVRYTPQGHSITTFSVASNRSYTTADGQSRDETEWFNIVAWNKLGEICGEYLRKGSRVYIEGRLQTRSWDDEESGQKRYKVEVIASDMIMLDSKREEEALPPEPPMPSSRQASSPTRPSQRPPAVAATTRRSTQRAETRDWDDELPF